MNKETKRSKKPEAWRAFMPFPIDGKEAQVPSLLLVQ